MHSEDQAIVIGEELDEPILSSSIKKTAGVAGRAPFGVLPVVLGVAVIALNLFMWFPNQWVFKPAGWGGYVAFIFLATSILIGVLLLLYPVVVSRSARVAELDDSRRVPGYAQLVFVPIVLGLLAPLLTAAAFDYQRSLSGTSRTPKSCVDVYEAAMSILKENPKFQMPTTDPDEQRCLVNKAISR